MAIPVVTLKQLMNGKSPQAFAQEFVHQIHLQRFAEKPEAIATKPAKKRAISRKLATKPEETPQNIEKSASFAERQASGPSVFTYLSNNIKQELEKASPSQRPAHFLHELCFSKLSNENARRVAEKVQALPRKAEQTAFCERLNGELQEMREKKLENAQKWGDRQMEDCRFQPEINEISRSKPNRNPREFFEYQVKWEEKVKDFAVFLFSTVDFYWD